MFRERSQRVVLALSIAVFIAVAYTVYFAEDKTSMLFVGDLPGFYGLGRLVLEGNGAHLYDLDYQREVQNRFWPALGQEVFPTMYPPLVAVVMASVAWIPPVPLRWLIAVFEITLLALCVRSVAKDKWFERWGLIIFSVPVLISVIGVQNTTISISLIVLMRHLLGNGRMFLSGCVAGLLFYKPQIGVIVGSVAAISGGLWFCAGLGAVLLLQYAIGYLVCKGEWFLPWLERMRQFSPIRASLDGFQMTGFAGHLPLNGVLGLSQQAWEIGVCGMWLGCVGAAVWRLRRVNAHPDSLFLLLLVSFPAFVPQTMFYDLGISIFWLCVTADISTRRALLRMVGIIVLVNLCFLFRSVTFSLVPVGAIVIASAGLIAFRRGGFLRKGAQHPR